MPRRFTDHEVFSCLVEFVQTTDDLRGTAYNERARKASWPAQATTVKRLGAHNFEAAVTQVATEHGDPEVRYRWSTCPNGYKHGDFSTIYATLAERAALNCKDCEDAAQRNAERLRRLPTFREQFPHAVSWLANPSDASSKGRIVYFRCTNCGADDVLWQPERHDPPMCHYCRSVREAVPGDLIERRGGGDLVLLDHDVARALKSRHGLHAPIDLGIVIPRGAVLADGMYGKYPLPALKPDIVLPVDRIAVEMDFDGKPGGRSHCDAETEAQDYQRDQVLSAIAWPVLRVRPPGWPSRGEWPWRVESSSRSPRVLADLIANAVRGRQGSVTPNVR
jgi:hypothetical protein